jgi:hypothetical protein
MDVIIVKVRCQLKRDGIWLGNVLILLTYEKAKAYTKPPRKSYPSKRRHRSSKNESIQTIIFIQPGLQENVVTNLNISAWAAWRFFWDRCYLFCSFLCRLASPKRARNLTMSTFGRERLSWWFSISFRRYLSIHANAVQSKGCLRKINILSMSWGCIISFGIFKINCHIQAGISLLLFHYIGWPIKLYGWGPIKNFFNNRWNGMSSIGGFSRFFETARTAWWSTRNKIKF